MNVRDSSCQNNCGLHFLSIMVLPSYFLQDMKESKVKIDTIFFENQHINPLSNYDKYKILA